VYLFEQERLRGECWWTGNCWNDQWRCGSGCGMYWQHPGHDFGIWMCPWCNWIITHYLLLLKHWIKLFAKAEPWSLLLRVGVLLYLLVCLAKMMHSKLLLLISWMRGLLRVPSMVTTNPALIFLLLWKSTWAG